jgi:hypothetical protein
MKAEREVVFGRSKMRKWESVYSERGQRNVLERNWY